MQWQLTGTDVLDCISACNSLSSCFLLLIIRVFQSPLWSGTKMPFLLYSLPFYTAQRGYAVECIRKQCFQ